MDNETQKKTLLTMRMAAMNILAGREHSRAELRQKLSIKFGKFDELLQQKAHLDKLIELVLEQLVDDDLLNESRFTECFVRSRINRGSGPVRIRRELMQRGISNDLINDYLDESYDFWQQHIETVRRRRFGEQYPQDYKEQSKQSRFLYQRGFSGEFIRRLFNENND